MKGHNEELERNYFENEFRLIPLEDGSYLAIVKKDGKEFVEKIDEFTSYVSSKDLIIKNNETYLTIRHFAGRWHGYLKVVQDIPKKESIKKAIKNITKKSVPKEA